MAGDQVADLEQTLSTRDKRRTSVVLRSAPQMVQPDIRRYASIDVIRCVAVLLMVQVHFVENLSWRDGASAWLYDLCTWLGMLPAPLFTFASGFSFSIWVRIQRASGRREGEITKCAVRRGLFLGALGLAFNFFVWFPEDLFNWDILTLIGSAMVILAFARALPAVALMLICVAVLLISPPLRVVSDYGAYWDNYEYTYDMTFRDVLFGYFLNGYFPLLPWIILPFAGFLTGEVFERRRIQVAAAKAPPQSTTGLVAFAMAMLAFAGLGVALESPYSSAFTKHYVDGLSMYPASTAYVAGVIGLCLLGFAALYRWLDGSVAEPRSGLLSTLVFRFSSFSLTVYILHHLMHLWPLWWYGMINGHEDPAFFWRNAISTPTALALAMLCFVLLYLGLIPLEKHKRYSVESQIRWLCD